jgi:c-di-GMP-related signal transduction protein
MIEREVFAKNQMIKHLNAIRDNEFLEGLDGNTMALINGHKSSTVVELEIRNDVKALEQRIKHFRKFLDEVSAL